MNWKNYCIVKFDTGEFAIRKGWFTYKYLDLISPRFKWASYDRFWWASNNEYFKDCLTKEEDKIRTIFDKLINADK